MPVAGFRETLFPHLAKPALATLIASVALAVAAVASAEAPPRQSLIFEGPGGRTPLTQWVLHRDPANEGALHGWARGGFSDPRLLASDSAFDTLRGDPRFVAMVGRMPRPQPVGSGQ